jgi:hypothetical protein
VNLVFTSQQSGFIFSLNMIRMAIITVAFLSLASLSCTSNSEPETQIDQNTVVHTAEQPCQSTSKRFEFENVSFSFDPCAFGDVKAEKIPDYPLEQADYKPDGVAPEHIRFDFDKGPSIGNRLLKYIRSNVFRKCTQLTNAR